MRTKHVNVLIALAAFVLFSFSCFCISRMTQTSNQLINCRNHILEFKEKILRLKNKTERNRQELINALSKMKYEMTQRENTSTDLVEKKMNTLGKDETVSNNTFEVLKFFFPHLRKVGRIYPDVIIGKEKTGVSFALGISTVSRGNQSYLKQTLNSVVSRMTLSEEKDSVVIVSVADRNEDYLKSVVDMITKRFKRQLKSGSLEVISIPAFFYPNMLHIKQSTEDSGKLESWRIKQVLDFCFLMLYAQPKAMYYLQLEDDIIAKKRYFTKITDFVHNITSNNWFYIEFSILGFIAVNFAPNSLLPQRNEVTYFVPWIRTTEGKLFKSEDLTDFVRFFLMFYKDKPIDLLLGDIFQVKMCNPGETPEKCAERNKQIRIRYKPSLFQHVGIQSSFSGREQYSKDIYY
ncbi:alpha-1,3-mannosyl-glycoprotein 4-beta-N-acetylglucosaminyltransferase-like protein MGAT4D isoform X1 [Prionailurus viverrinus]|uniref:alpha-1,3-mannosyl-glycoprotein 4-beta-N-acetylglucosaminyltransferase-like protein MGAT4D isoform X1 n=2 Tax=Prionailurus viverrinus TaxID=61388 RepID=UPI001FF610C9|nr:alpha-1,3-mannosyl-glycoprotein 4-beta-N-acetylglucosaminyltransferase-like protein MGAT4D isoform X1 [Prionailurus viverrinus]